MKTLKNILLEDPFRLSGIIVIVISAAVFTIGACLIQSKDAELLSFFICYCITGIFTCAVLLKAFMTHRWRISHGKIEYTTLMLILWLISAFAFNRELSIFDHSTTWLSIYLCLSGITVVTSTFQQHLSLLLRHILSFFLGAALALFCYFALYLVPLYAIGALAAIFLGLSAHVYAPVFLVIIIAVSVTRFNRKTVVLKYSFLAGLALPILICICFLIQWNSIYNKVTRTQNHHILSGSHLPEWVDVAQHLPKSFITERFLKADLVYTTPNEINNWFWGDFGRSSFGESRKHDPLVMISALLTGKSSLEEKDRIRILKSVFDSRHLAQERLWSGDNLLTTNVISNVKIYPEYRMAYTEKTLSIKNTSTNNRGGDQEAIYTFHLPEGAVVSSLSLWINGIEERARLTTKTKADSAYKTIVGVENRDPSVIHWQEGNEVTVRVFPCTTKAQRKFKIGITSPLLLEQQRLIYQNASFEGPSPKNAMESILVNFSTPAQSPETDLDKVGAEYRTDRSYQESWLLSVAKVPLAKNGFSFAGSGYQLKDAESVQIYFKPAFVYLDVNSAWSHEELKAIWANIKTQKVYAYDEQLIQLNDNNIDHIFKRLSKLNFSLFPFYKITSPETALVISKSNQHSPNLSDLDQSSFQVKTSTFLTNNPGVHLYHIGALASPYLKTLKQFGIFRYGSGDLGRLTAQLRNNQFRETQKLENTITIASSNVVVQKSTDTTTTQAPNHLLRLFAYNDILKKIGSSYFKKDYIQEELLAIADQAFIVSPVSSLIVLETRKDYERFDIDKSKNSLQNATIQSSGAAPEPHEWVLILLSAAVILYFTCRSSFSDRLRLKWK